MAKQLNIDLRVSADIKQAKANFESLQKTLFKLQESTRIDVKDESLSKAQKAAGDLARNLQQATNVNTGKLDLNKFSQSLNKSGQDLKKLHQQLTSLGPEGEQAFFKLTQSIATADASTLNLGKKISSLGTVLKNTARWQLSSSLLHGFMGAISGAYRYAQDLNESLNNIRIVTDQNIDQMSKFAKEANNAAKALSTTTTQYTDASLIYYQQGLSDEDVKRRTDATIKLANVSRQSAEEVSSQMTAIWNNFAKGNENLEYYEDVITKLGATTASSSSEIANGLSKFASVADTVGLSYEKASAALATVVAETRQSEDIVGTAFKTMFARLEGLNLGETLEDGVDLNKYSKALEAVGVSILDNNGKIKSMNDILDETGAKWQNIGKEQQIALAQTVAGVRQYTQFIALMDNYDKVLKNESVAKSSAGTVNEQAKVYAESWEAARDRVTAALETIYKQLLNDNFFIDMLNGAEKFLDFISNIIDGLGGVKGILLLISSIFMQYYAKEMPRVLQSLRDNIGVITGASQQRAQALLNEAREELELNAAMESRNKQMTAMATTASVTAKMTEALNKARKGLSQTEIEAYEYEIKLAGAIGKTTEELGKEIDQLEKKGKATADQLTRQINRDDNEENRINRLSANEQIEESYNYEQAKQDNEKRLQEKAVIESHKKKTQNSMLQKQEELANNNLTDGQRWSRTMNIAKDKKSIEKDNTRLEEIEKENVLFEEMTKKYQKFIQYSKMSGKELFQEMEKLSKASGKRNLIVDEIGSKQQEWKDNFNKINKNGSADFSSLIKEVEKYKQKLEEAGVATKEIDNALDEIGKGNISGIDKIFNALNAAIDENNADLELLQSQLRLLGVSDKDINELTKMWERAGEGAEEFKAKVEEIKNKIGELPQHEIKISEGLTQMASAAMQVSMIINGFQNIGRIFSDEDLSVGEKIIQTMTAVGSMLPMITALTNKQRIVEMGAVAAKILHIGATKADTAAETASIGAKIASGTAGWYALGPLLLFVAIAAAVVAAIVLITNALMAAANAESEEEKAARLANEELERSKKAAEEAKQAYEDLKSAVSNYDSAVEALEKCTKGTQEWRDAFKEVLAQASALIAAYPELLNYNTLYKEDGTLNQDVLHEAINRSQQIAMNAANIQMLNTSKVSSVEAQADKSNIIQQFKNMDQSRGIFATSDGGFIHGADFIEPIVQKSIDQKLDFSNENIVKDFVEEQLQGYNLIGEDFASATDIMVQALTDSSEKLQKLGNEVDSLSTQMYNASNMIFSNYFADKNFKNKNEEIAYQNAYEEEAQKITSELRKGVVAAHTPSFGSTEEGVLNNHDIYGGEQWSRASYDKLVKAYAKKHGLTLKDDDHHGVTWRDGNAFVQFVGQKEEDQKTIEEIFNEVLPQLLEEQRTEIEEKAQQQYRETGNEIDVVKYFRTKGDFDKISYNELQRQVLDKDNNIKDVLNEDKIKEDIAQKLNKDISKVTDDEVKEVKQRYRNEITGIINTIEEIPDSMKKAFGQDLINNIDTGSLKAVSDMYVKVLMNGGEEGVDFIKSIIKDSGKEAKDVLSVLSSMDLENMNLKNVNASLKDLGLSFQMTEAQIYSFKNYLIQTSNATAEVAQETYKTISSILSKLKKQGDIIEEEDYQKLISLNPAIESFFTTLADGTHMLTGEVQDFKTAMQTATTNQFYQAIQNKENAIAAYDFLSKSPVVSSQTMIQRHGQAGNSVSYNAETGKYELSEEGKAGSDIYEQNKEQVQAYLDILKDRGDSKVANYETQIAEEKNLNAMTIELSESMEKLNLSTEDYTDLVKDLSKENSYLIDSMKESFYQTAIANAGLDYEATENYANSLMDIYETQGLTKDGARQLAIANQRLDRGLSSLNDNFEKWKNSLNNTNRASAEYAETIGEIRKSFADLLNVADTNELSLKWIEKWAKDADKMKKILDGDTEAIQEFRESAFAEMTTNVFKEVGDSAKAVIEDIQDDKIKSSLETLINQLKDGKISAEGLKQELTSIGDTSIGNNIRLSDDYTNALNTMLQQGLITEQQLNDVFASIGYKPRMTVKSVRQEIKVPNYKTIEHITEKPKNENGEYTRTVWTETEEMPDSPKTMVQYTPVAQIESADSATGNIEVVNAGSMNISPSYSSTTSGKSSDSSNKSSSSPTTKAASHDHEVNRYSNEENAIKGLSEQYDRLNKAKDKAFGKSRIQAIEAEIKHLKALREASGNYLDAIVGKGNADKVAKAIFKGENIGQMIANGSLSGTARADYNSLFGGLSASGKGVEYSAKDSNGNEWLVSDNYSLSGFNSLFGTNLQFNLDSYGNIQNKDAIYNLLQNLKNNENDAYSRIADPSAGSTTEYNRRMAYLEAIKERVDQFEETVDLMSEKTDEYLDYIASIQEKNAELITSKMEHGVNLGQKTLQRLERAIKVLGDNIYKTAEAMSAWFNTTFKEGIEANKQQGQAYAQALAETAEKIRLYDQKDGYFNEDAIDPASAAELFSSIEDGYDSLIDDLLNRIEEGKAYYGNVLDYWNNKLDKVNSAIQTNTQLLEHFQTVLNLLGRSADYEAIGTVLQGQLDNAQSDYISRKAQAEVAKQAYKRAVQDREGLISRGISDEALEEYDENVLQIAFQNYQEKADAMYSALEKYIETANAKFENEINKAFAESEDRLTGQWGSFDDLDAAMQRQRSVSDEYLTKTNQIYEANTLLRKLSQDIDKTDSRIAKEKLKSFANEIESMKVQEKLNKSDLEIAKARYELLQAEIALEDAKNAKTTVRLKRDSSGNYGYIYTADQDTIDDAEQNLADKQNNLYNLVLQQTQEYGEKMIQLRKEYEAEIKGVIEAYQNGEITSREELELKLQDINTKYRELEYASMYSYETAKLWLNRTGAEGQTEAWTSSFDEIITEHRLFNNESENNVTELTNHIEANLDELDSQREYFTEEAKLGNKDLKNTIDEITASTEALSKKITNRNGLADSMNVAVSAAQQLSVAFASQYSALRDLIGQYSAAADEANKLYYKTVNLINAQTAYNVAKNGATSVSWDIDSGKQGVYDNSSTNNNSNNNNSGNGISVATGNSSSSSGNRKFSSITFNYDPGTGRYMPYINYIDKDGKMKTVKVGTTFPDTSWGPVQNSTPYKEIKKSLGIVGGKTGMYTGSWNGPDIEENGKLAFLHQKELVLNADDTKNMLSAVKLIRQINQSIDLQAAAYNTATSGFSIGQLANSNQTLQQDVTIHADFPNVRDHNEIEEAFNNLINRAVQFANRD